MLLLLHLGSHSSDPLLHHQFFSFSLIASSRRFIRSHALTLSKVNDRLYYREARREATREGRADTGDSLIHKNQRRRQKNETRREEDGRS
jgi:serine phosphatase RsbU (regulator of sigma subunit)